MPYTDASGVQIPVGTDSFNPTAQFKTWQDKNATYNWFLACDLDSERTALAAPVLRDGLRVYVKGTGITWQRAGTTWKNLGLEDVGTVTNASGVTATTSLLRSGNTVSLIITEAQKTAAWTNGATVATIPAAWAPPATFLLNAVEGSTGAMKFGSVSAAGVVAINGATGSGSAGRVTLNGTWVIVP